MEITVQRCGGFAGLTEPVAAVNTAQLDAAAAQRITRLLQEIDFFHLPATVSGGAVGADLFYYEVTTIDGPRQHSVTFPADEHNLDTAPLHRLLQLLTQMAE